MKTFQLFFLSLLCGTMLWAGESWSQTLETVVVYKQNFHELDYHQENEAVAVCPTGTTVIGGGFEKLSFVITTCDIYMSRPDKEKNAWVVRNHNTRTIAAPCYLGVYALCGKIVK
jgi:hypothetical protein